MLRRGLKCEVTWLKRRIFKMPGIPARYAETIWEAQLEIFREKFGREPGLNEPVFFDPDMDKPTPVPLKKMRKSLDTAMRRAGYSERL